MSIIWTCLLAVVCLLATAQVSASNAYYNDGNGILQNVFQADYDGVTAGVQSCADCHGASNSCSGGQSSFVGYDGVRACYSTIRSYLSINFMPDGGPFGQNATFESRLQTWENAGFPLSPATVSNLTATSVDNNDATLGATFDTNTASGGSYLLQYKLDSSGTYITLLSATRNSTAAAAINSGTSLNGLLCNETYDYRARASNGGGNSAFITGTFNTSACTPPVISGSTATVQMSEDGSPTPFSAPNLSVSDDDSGTLSWSASSQPVIQGTATPAGSASASGTGNSESISYAPPLNFVGVVEFTVRVTNGTTGQFDERTIVVNVNAENDPPEITEGNGPLAIPATDEDTSTMHTLNATDPEGDNITWSVSGSPNHGVVIFPPGDANSKTFTYTPGPDAVTTGSYTVVATSSGVQTDSIVINVPINAINDPPSINAVGAQSGTEGQLITITPTVVDPDDLNNGVDLTWSIVSGLQPGMMISNTGQITWTPPLGTPPPPATFNQTYPIIIDVQDDGSDHGQPPDQDAFTITVNPPDIDGDMVADYNDYCPGVTQAIIDSADGSNADNDGDGTFGSDADPNDAVGGDVCDIDDDNDGMPDSFEIANSFDPFDAADAALDADGDGVTNLQEFLDGTNPNLTNLVIDATGYLTPHGLVPPEPTTIHALATAVTPVFSQADPVSDNPEGPYRPGDNTITWMPSNGSDDDLATNDPGNLVSDPPTQPFSIRPLASIDVDQQVAENAVATVNVRLNGESPSWRAAAPTPAIVNYSISGTAVNPDDHDAMSGSLSFPVGVYSQPITVNVAADAVTDPDETIVVRLTSATNAVIGSNARHTMTIVESNITPRARLQFFQAGDSVSTTFDDSAITVDATPSDVNAGQTLRCDWSGTDNALLPPGIVADCGASPDWTIVMPTAGTYLVDVVVSDNGNPVRSTRVSRILRVDAPPAVALGAAVDTDGDGDFDLAEGYADPDGDGIPAYLDNIDDANLVPDQTANLDSMLLLETEPGLILRRGSTTQAANIIGALVSDADIQQFGSPSGGAPVNAEDSFEHIGGIYDFEIDGLIPGASASVVIPLQSAIPPQASYRKYHPTTGWTDFVVNANNRVASALGELGACPEPGSSAYTDGLQYLANCIQLTIQDGGPNDTDNQANGVINDPATVGLVLTEPEGFEEVEEGSGGGRVSLLLLALLSVLGGFACRRRARGLKIE